MAKVPRNNFHVQPLVNDPAGDKWSLSADKNTQRRLQLDPPVLYFRNFKAAQRSARSIAKGWEPAELLYHRLPKKGENPNLYPIYNKDSFGDDPNPPAGILKKTANRRK